MPAAPRIDPTSSTAPPSPPERAPAADPPHGGMGAPAVLPRPARSVRNVDAPRLLERFLVSAASAFLGIRIYLALTGYPQIGGHGLHIAHLLWGGLLLLVAAVMTLVFLGRRVRFAASIVGGIGFGAFIDELGKFITSDNDYFFRPAVALIYAIFVLLYVAFQAIVERAPASPAAALPQAIDLIEAGTIRGFTPELRREATMLLARADPRHPLVPPLRASLASIPSRSASAAGVVERATGALGSGYRWLVGRGWFLPLVVALAAMHAAFGVAAVVSEVTADPAFAGPDRSVSPFVAIKAAAQAVSMALLAVGLWRWRASRLGAYHWLRRAVVVSLLVVQPLAFYTNQLTAAWGLLFSLALFAALNFASDREKALPSEAKADDPARAVARPADG